jgi:hypothetical protein
VGECHSKPSLVIWMARTRSWPGLVAQPQRYIIHRNEGLIQVMRSHLNGATNVPAARAAAVSMPGRG